MPASTAPPDGGTPGEPASPATVVALMRWRNWRLPVKLAAITAVPVVLALALGVLTVRTQVQRSAAYDRSDRLVALGEEVLTLVSGLQAEREASARQLATGAGPAERGAGAAGPDLAGAAALRPQREAVDAGVTVVGKARAELARPSEAVTARLAGADRLIQRLPPLRQQISGGGLGAAAAIGAYGEIVDGLLAMHRALASDIEAAELARTATALHDLAEVTDQLSRQRSLVAVAAARRDMPAAELAALRASDVRLADRLDSFAAAASPAQLEDYRRTVTGPGVDTRNEWVHRLLADPAAAPPSPAEWDAVSGMAIGLTTQVFRRMQGPLVAASAALQARASNRAGTASVVLFAAFVLAAAVGVVITRQLLGSLGSLRRTALEVAGHGLPAAVAAIRDGGRPVAPRPVPVRTTEELGQLALAFDGVHRQALRLAADEAALRTGYSSVFVNLSRRSQSLVQRQLQLLERLERDEEDADQLDMLFRLDHLATRMRRNNENLMVLSGSDVVRRSAEPTPLADLLRAAVSEIEHYQRVELRPAPQLQVAGHAAGDLVRLVAELLDNATAFSPPDNPVSLAAHRCDSGAVVVNVLDQGIGMNDEEIAAANAQLRGTGPVGLPQSRRMGLFVVARLAGRHGFEVRLHGGQDLQGVQATVTVPPELVIVAPRPEPRPAAAPAVAAHRPARPGRPGDLPPSPAGWQPDAVPAAEPGDRASPAGDPGRRGEPAPVCGSAPAAGDPALAAADPGDLPKRVTDGNGRPRQGARSVGGYPRLGDRPRWWDEAGWSEGSMRPPRRSEVSTPIFDQMASVWFAASGTAQEPAEATVTGDAEPGDAVTGGAVTGGAEPGVPGAGDGSGGAAATAEPAVPEQDAGPEQDAVPGQDAILEQDAVSGQEAIPEQRADPGQPDAAGQDTGVPAAAASQDRPWYSAADEGWRAVRALSAATPSEYTPAGLPRRTPRQSLLPGSVAITPPRNGNGGQPAVILRDADDVRSRLSSLRDGLSRGRQGLDRPATEPIGQAEATRETAETEMTGVAEATGETEREGSAP